MIHQKCPKIDATKVQMPIVNQMKISRLSLKYGLDYFVLKNTAINANLAEVIYLSNLNRKTLLRLDSD
jgi:N-acetylmuramoyl-L-alanine amidase